VYLWTKARPHVRPRSEPMELHQVESVGVGRARRDLYEILRSVEGGSHYLLLRFDRPVAAVIPHADYLAFSELARKDALARALLQGKGYDPAKLTAQEFLDLLAAHVKEGSDAG
jgi:antitoxin (DNA-binding transcriptional repressor) of toxin-antitoxin stability system